MKTRNIAILLAVLLLLPACTPTNLPPPSAMSLYSQPVESTAASTPTAEPTVVDETLDDIKEMLQYEFTGLEHTKESPRNVNSPFTYTSGASGYNIAPAPYYDEESDTLYFVNYGQNNDGFLYTRSSEVNKPLIEMPVNFPNYHSEYIYFMTNDDCGILYGYTANPFGKIYRYNTLTESIELVLEQDVRQLCIVGDYLYYRSAYIIGSNGYPAENSDGTFMGNEPFRLSLNGGEPEAMGDFLPQFYGEYQLRFVPTERAEDGVMGALELVSENETVSIGSAFVAYSDGEEFIIAGDTLWYRVIIGGKRQLISIDLPTGEMTYYQSQAIIRLYTVMDDEVFVLPLKPGDYKLMQIEKCNVGGGSFSSVGEYRTKDFRNELLGTYEAIRTDGKHLYVVLRTALVTLPDGTHPYEPEQILLTRVIFAQDGTYELEIINKPDIVG